MDFLLYKITAPVNLQFAGMELWICNPLSWGNLS